MGLLDWAMPGSQLLATGINAWSTAQANKKNEELQREEWAREDSSYQRKVADLKAAGLNPALALGGGSPSSLAFRVAAPQVEAPDMTAPIRMNLARQQVAMTGYDMNLKQAEVSIANAVAARKSAEEWYWEKYYNYRAQHAESDAEYDFQHGMFRTQSDAIAVNKGQVDVENAIRAGRLSDFMYQLETQLGAPGSGPQIIRAILGGSGGMLDLIRTLK